VTRAGPRIHEFVLRAFKRSASACAVTARRCRRRCRRCRQKRRDRERTRGKKKGEGEPGRHNYKLHRYTQITRLLCASQPPDDHAYAHASSAVAREKTGRKERERERKRERKETTGRGPSERNEHQRVRERENCARAQLPFILSDAVRASRAQIARAIEFSLSGRREQRGVFSQCRGVATPGRIGPRSRAARSRRRGVASNKRLDLTPEQRADNVVSRCFYAKESPRCPRDTRAIYRHA